MKNLAFITCFVLMLSCSSDSVRQNSFEGTWIWQTSTGGIDGRTETPESTGKSIRLEFSNGSFKKYVDDQLNEDLTYELVSGPSFRTETNVPLIFYSNEMKQSFEINGDTLTLYDECLDCFISVYIRE